MGQQRRKRGKGNVWAEITKRVEIENGDRSGCDKVRSKILNEARLRRIGTKLKGVRYKVERSKIQG